MRRILLVLCYCFVHDAMAIELIAHRGYSCRTLENTIGSVNYAWRAGSDGVEIDLRVSKDGVVFLFHDDNIHDILISKMDYSEIGSLVEYTAPSFESILDLGNPPGYFVLDLKDKDPARYISIAALITKSGINQNRFVVQSNNTAALMAVKEYLPGASFYYLSHLKRRFPFYLTPRPSRVLNRIRGLEIDGVSVKGRRFIDEHFVQEFKEAGYLVNVWTINDPARASYYRDIGVDGIITDVIEEIRSELFDGRKIEGQCLSSGQDVS
jgi:glycerophosphoryl diester phosphodiesterase